MAEGKNMPLCLSKKGQGIMSDSDQYLTLNKYDWKCICWPGFCMLQSDSQGD